jgi:serine/threonine protein phosphatase PrpC
VEETLRTNLPVLAGDSGTTAVAIIMKGKELYLAHTGDSRAIIGRREPAEGGAEGKIVPVQLTRDHTPACPAEAANIKAKGGVCMPAVC